MKENTLGKERVGKFWLVSFCDSRMVSALERLRSQAVGLDLFQEIVLMTEADLAPWFVEKLKDHLVLGSRGYGYWTWRPQVVLQAFEKMAFGDILLYVDTGCHLSLDRREKLIEYFEEADKHELVCFQRRSRGLRSVSESCGREGDWCKGDLLDFFSVRNDASVVESAQISGGVFLVKKTRGTVGFFELYRSIAMEHIHLFDDTPSVSVNLPGFVEHRHDQSVFSIMVKTWVTRSSGEIECIGFYAPKVKWWFNRWAWPRTWDDVRKKGDGAILAKRDRGLPEYKIMSLRFRINLGRKVSLVRLMKKRQIGSVEGDYDMSHCLKVFHIGKHYFALEQRYEHGE